MHWSIRTTTPLDPGKTKALVTIIPDQNLEINILPLEKFGEGLKKIINIDLTGAKMLL